MCESMIHRLKLLLIAVSCLSLANCAYLPWGGNDEPIKPSEPVVKPSEPVAKPSKPVTKPTKPTKPAAKPTKPAKPKPPPEYADTQVVVDIDKQTLYLFKKSKLLKYYAISSSKFGIGNAQDSNKTPLGKHYIAHKIGGNAPINTIFKARMNTQKVALVNDETEEDVITSRILWLKGLERGINKGPGIDSYQRYIYIHGTADEAAIGQPASFGCIRMKNQDVVELFKQVKSGRYGTQVHIVKSMKDLKKPPLTGS